MVKNSSVQICLVLVYLCVTFSNQEITLDQLCYETNLQNLKDRNVDKIGKQLEIGLLLVIDYNEERQSYSVDPEVESESIKVAFQNNHDVSVFLDTMSITEILKGFH